MVHYSHGLLVATLFGGSVGAEAQKAPLDPRPVTFAMGQAGEDTKLIGEIPIRIFGGESFKISMREGGPALAKTESFSIEGITIRTLPPEDRSRARSMNWLYSLKLNTNERVKGIKVEELFTDKPSVLRVETLNPVIKQGRWQKLSDPAEITPKELPWFFTEKASMFVFRITVTFANGQSIGAIQAAYFPALTKQKLLNPGLPPKN